MNAEENVSEKVSVMNASEKVSETVSVMNARAYFRQKAATSILTVLTWPIELRHYVESTPRR